MPECIDEAEGVQAVVGGIREAGRRRLAWMEASARDRLGIASIKAFIFAGSGLPVAGSGTVAASRS